MLLPISIVLDRSTALRPSRGGPGVDPGSPISAGAWAVVYSRRRPAAAPRAARPRSAMSGESLAVAGMLVLLVVSVVVSFVVLAVVVSTLGAGGVVGVVS